MIALRIIWALAAAAAYQLATNVYLQAILLVANGHWRIAAAELLVWIAINALAVVTSIARVSKLTGAPIITAPDWLFVFGNEEDGYASARATSTHPTWPWWAVAFVECAWRNRLRNLPFVSCLSFLHKLPTPLIEEWRCTFGQLRLSLRWCGWMTEFEYDVSSWQRFGDFGPRLDQWFHRVSWAYRPFGRY